MANIDDKIVSMSFESDKFESGVRKSITSIDNLKKSLQFPNAGKGLEKINEAANRINFGGMLAGIDNIQKKLGYLSVASLAIFANIAGAAVKAGAQVVKSFSLQPILDGFKEYSTNLNAIQTILANTQASGATLDDVNAALLNLNKYSDKTIYNFSQMAKNIGTFTAAGVDLKTSTEAIKGIANLAALSGSSADQASTAMYQLSQAISSGRVSLQDWNSVVNAGMGGTVFQRALAQTATAMGTLKDSSLKLVGPMKNVSINGESFRNSIQTGPGKKSWLTSDVLTKTLSTFTGDMTDAQLAAEGFNAEQIKSIQQTAKTAQHAATEVKTITQVFDVAKETAGSGWAQTFQIIFGNFNEAKKTFTSLSNSINAFININSAARNKVLADWKKLGGRTELIDGIRIVFKNLGLILKPIREAFREIFPAKTGKDLYNFTLRFKALAQELKPSPKTIENLHRTFKGLFAILDIGKQVLGGVFRLFRDLFTSVGGGKGGFLSLTAIVGDFFVRVDNALKKGNALNNFFVKMGVVLAIPISFLKELAHAIANLFTGFSPGGFSYQIDGMTKVMTPFQKVLAKVTDLWHRFIDGFGNSDEIFQKIADALVSFSQSLGPAISSAVSNINFEAILAVIRTGLLVGLVVMFKKFLGHGALEEQLLRVFGKSFGRLGGGILKNVSLGFKSFSGTMQAMQTNLKAKTLKEIAIAIALLAASVVAMSFIDPKRLNSAMVALTVMFGELVGSMKFIDEFISRGGAVKLPIIAATLIALAGAIDLLTIAVFALSRMDWDQLKKGLGGVGVLLGILTAAAIPLSKNSAGLIRAGIGITAIAVGLNVLALAVHQFGNMDFKTLGKGLVSVAASLVIIAGAMKVMPKGMIAQSVALIAIATALNILAKAVSSMGALDWKIIGRGLAGIAGSLVAIAAGMKLMPKNIAITAAGLLLVSLSLDKIVKAVAKMGKMSLREIAKGLIGLAGALVVLGESLLAMEGSIGGAVALGVAAAGISILVPALIALGKQSKKTLVTALIALGAAFATLAVAGLALGPVAPALLAFGAALFLIGGGLALAGVGIALIGVGLAAIAVAGPAAVAVLLKAITDFVAAIPKLATDLVLGLLAMVQAFAKTAPKFVDAMIKILNSLLDAIPKVIPKLVKAIEVLIDAIIKVFADKQDKVIAAGLALLIALMKGISKNINQIIALAGDIVVKLLLGLASYEEKIIAAGAQVIISFIKGITNNFTKIVTAGIHAAGKFITALVKGMLGLIDKGAQGLIDFLNGVAKIIDKREPEIIEAFTNIGEAIIKGMIKGLGNEAGNLFKKIGSIGHGAVKVMKHVLGVFSPSVVFINIGENVTKGLVIGINNIAPEVYKAITTMGNNMSKALNPHAWDHLLSVEPKITPVVDDTNIRRAASSISKMFAHPMMKPEFSLGQALKISDEQRVAAAESLTPTTQSTAIKFEQNNYSPEALNAVDIYRQTRNQLSKLKTVYTPA